MNTLFSVIVPLYNKRAFVGTAIRSILNQDALSIEIIVVDDGSVDGGGDLVAALNDPRIRLIRQENSGVSIARNVGVAAAVGEFICFLDADDWYFPGYLAYVRQMIAKHPEAIAYTTAFCEVEATAQTGKMDTVKLGADNTQMLTDFFADWADGPKFCTGSICVRKQTLLDLDGMFPPGESMAEDQDVWFRLAERGSIAFSPQATVAYRRNVTDSLTTLQPVHTILPAFARLANRMRLDSFPSHMRISAKRFLAKNYIAIARDNFYAGRRLYALYYLLISDRPGCSRYWWVTFFMALLCPRQIAEIQAIRRHKNRISNVKIV